MTEKSWQDDEQESDVRLKHRDDRRLRLSTLRRLDDLAADYHLQRRQTHDALTGGERRVGVGVDFAELHLAVLMAQLIENGGQLLARRSPVGPIVNDDWTA